MNHRLLTLVLLLFATLVTMAVPASSHAGWSSDKPVAAAVGDQSQPQITSDGAGGAIIVWQDQRNGVHWNVYARRVNANGTLLWAAGGVPAGAAERDQIAPQVISDGNGGAIVLWKEENFASTDIYLQRVDANGAMRWNPRGVAVASGSKYSEPRMATDGSGGAIVTWVDSRVTSPASELYAQRVGADGSLLWPPEGLAVSPLYDVPYPGTHVLSPQIMPDGSGGAIVVWARSERYAGIYAQKIDSAGALVWPPDAVRLGDGRSFAAVNASDSGVMVIWEDSRQNTVHGQRLNPSGAPLWGAGGVSVSPAAADMQIVQAVADGSGGAFFFRRNFESGSAVRAQRIDTNGRRYWPLAGVAISSGDTFQAASDGSGGVIMVWSIPHSQLATGGYDNIQAQRLSAKGALLWGAEGVNVSTVALLPYQVVFPQLVADGSRGALITWEDRKNNRDLDILAQRVAAAGSLPAVRVLSPNLPEVLPAGSSWTVRWQAPPRAVQFMIHYTPDEGMTWRPVTTGMVSGCSYQWTVPRLWNNQKRCRVRVTGYDAAGSEIGVDASDLPFRIEVVRLTSPNGGEAITAESAYQVTWATYGTAKVVEKVTLTYSIDGGVTWRIAGAALANTGTFTWTPPSVALAKTRCRVKVFLQGGDGVSLGSDESDQTFVLNPAPLPAWSNNPKVNNAVATSASNQLRPQITSDGSGGAIVTWWEYNGESYDIRARRFEAGGAMLWTSLVAAVDSVDVENFQPQVISDDAGGAIIAWEDYRSGTLALHAQRIDANGSTLWEPDGVAIPVSDCSTAFPTLVADGNGGAIITGAYQTGFSTIVEIFAARISAGGEILWLSDVASTDTELFDFFSPEIASDANGGAVITWHAFLGGGNFDIYAQRVDANGELLWTPGGIALTTAAHGQRFPRLTGDNQGGAVIAWVDDASGDYSALYAQKVDANGTVLWRNGGVRLSTTATVMAGEMLLTVTSFPEIVEDGSGGAIIAWMDTRSGSNLDLYAQRIDATGTLLWRRNGTIVSIASGDQTFPQMVSDGQGGAIVTWSDGRRGTDLDIYAQRIGANGTPLWKLNGAAASIATGGQSFPQLVSDGANGAVVTWMDTRTGIDADIYAQKLLATGTLP